MSDNLIVKLGADTSEFKGQIASASNDFKNTFSAAAGSKIGEEFARAFNRKIGLGDVAKAALVSLGIDAKSIAENIARWFTGVSKEEEENFKKLGDLSERVADANIAAARASLDAEQKYQLALRDRESALKRIADVDKSTAKGQVELREQELRLAQASMIIAQHKLDIERRINEEISQQISLGDLQRKANLDAVPLLGRRIQLLKDDVILAKAAVDIAENQSQKDAWMAVLKQRQLELTQLEVQFKKEHSLTQEQIVEKTKLEADLQIGKILPADRARLEQLKLIAKEKDNQAKIDTILAKPAKERTEQEKITLGALNQQNKELDAQITRYTKIIDQLKSVVQEIQNTKQGDVSDLSGDSGLLKVLSGFAPLYNPGEQATYEKNLVAQARAEIQYQIDELQQKLNAYLSSGSALGAYEIPAIRERIDALRQRQNNVNSFVFNPNYSDKAGQGVFASQVSSIGDPLGLQKKTTDALTSVSDGIQEINNRLRLAGLGNGG